MPTVPTSSVPDPPARHAPPPPLPHPRRVIPPALQYCRFGRTFTASPLSQTGPPRPPSVECDPSVLQRRRRDDAIHHRRPVGFGSRPSPSAAAKEIVDGFAQIAVRNEQFVRQRRSGDGGCVVAPQPLRNCVAFVRVPVRSDDGIGKESAAQRTAKGRRNAPHRQFRQRRHRRIVVGLCGAHRPIDKRTALTVN